MPIKEDATFREFVSRFAATSILGTQGQVVRALFKKGVTLGKLNRPEEELTAYDVLVHRFEESAEPGIQEQVANARNGIGFIRLKEAKRYWSDSTRREQALSTALEEFNKALPHHLDKPLVLGNQSYTLFLLGRRDEAREPMRQALKDGGERLYKCEVEDAALRPVSVDAAFLAFLDEVWREVHGTEPPKPGVATNEGEGE